MPDNNTFADGWEVPDSLDLPGRPTHTDLSVISDCVLAADAASTEGRWAQYTQNLLKDQFQAVTSAAMHEARVVYESAEKNPEQSSPGTGAWIIGFATGIRSAREKQGYWDRDQRPTSVIPDASHRSATGPDPNAGLVALLDGVDPASVVWVARQRWMRAEESGRLNPGTMLGMLAATWLDGFCAGYRFDKVKAVHQRRTDQR